MRRIFVGEGKWFDAEQAEQYPSTLEKTMDQTLFRTRKGRYILQEGVIDAGEEVEYVAMHDKNAWEWLVSNGYDMHVPEEFLAEREV